MQMSITQLLLIAVGLMAFMVLGYLAFAGPSASKASARRLQAVRYRHSDSTTDRVEAQLKKAVAARKPKMHQIAGSESRVAALALRLSGFDIACVVATATTIQPPCWSRRSCRLRSGSRGRATG